MKYYHFYMSGMAIVTDYDVTAECGLFQDFLRTCIILQSDLSCKCSAFKIKIPQPYCELIYQFQVLRCWQGFGKNICQVVRRGDLSTRNVAIPFEFVYIVMFQSEVF
eukprot:g29235.t1